MPVTALCGSPITIDMDYNAARNVRLVMTPLRID